MRILLVDQYGELGGGQRCLLEAAEGFRAANWQVYAAVPPAGPLGAHLASHCAEVFSLACGPFTPTRKSMRDGVRFALQLPGQVAALRRTIEERRIDAIYVNGAQVLPAAALARAGRPVVFHCHWVITQALAAAICRQAARWSQAFCVASSGFVARSLETFVPPSRIRVVYNGAAGKGRRLRPPAAPSHLAPCRIAMLGRIAPEKGQLEFVRAARILSAASPSLRFTVGGAPMFSSQGYFEQVRSEAADLPVEFPGWVGAVPEWLAGVDLLVVPSDATDNIPRVILEAFAAGVPVIARRSGGIPELIEDGVSGWLVEGQGPDALARAIQAALASPRSMSGIAERAFERWNSHYTVGRFQSELCEAVEQAVRVHHQRAPRVSAGKNAAA